MPHRAADDELPRRVDEDLGAGGGQLGARLGLGLGLQDAAALGQGRIEPAAGGAEDLAGGGPALARGFRKAWPCASSMAVMNPSSKCTTYPAISFYRSRKC